MSTMTLPQTNGAAAYAPAPVWLQSSVQTFFTGFNWEDQPPEVQELRMTATIEGSTEPLSLTLSVSQFFATVNWEGTQIAEVPTFEDFMTEESAADDFTLDSFSDLF